MTPTDEAGRDCGSGVLRTKRGYDGVMRAVVSLGGSVLVPEPNADRVAGYAAAVEEVAAAAEIAVVVGGGGVAREYIGAARELGADEVTLDRLGIDVTHLNARLLVAGMGDAATLATDYGTAETAVRRGETPVMGGITPAQTTDAVAAVLAESVDADLLVFGTATNGVYDADPETNPDATKHDELTPAELVEIVSSMSRNAGASAPVDLVAAKLIDRASLRTVVVDATDPDALVDAVLHREHGGTDVIPET